MMDKLRLWAWYLALAISVAVALISFYAGESFLRVVLSAIFGFALIYGISMISITVFEKTGMEYEAQSVGAFLDIAVGQEDNLPIDSERQNLTGASSRQVLYTKNGQTPSARAGQLNQEFADGEPSAEKQAEIVRRMGWGD